MKPIALQSGGGEDFQLTYRLLETRQDTTLYRIIQFKKQIHRIRRSEFIGAPWVYKYITK